MKRVDTTTPRLASASGTFGQEADYGGDVAEPVPVATAFMRVTQTITVPIFASENGKQTYGSVIDKMLIDQFKDFPDTKVLEIGLELSEAEADRLRASGGKQ